MATATVVITYTPATGDAKAKTTSMTVGGVAYASLTAAAIRDTTFLLRDAAKTLSGTTNATSGSAPFEGTAASKGPTT